MIHINLLILLTAIFEIWTFYRFINLALLKKDKRHPSLRFKKNGRTVFRQNRYSVFLPSLRDAEQIIFHVPALQCRGIFSYFCGRISFFIYSHYKHLVKNFVTSAGVTFVGQPQGIAPAENVTEFLCRYLITAIQENKT